MYKSRFPDCPECKDRHPGDHILDRYMPGCTHEQRHEARKNLYGFVGVLLRIAERRAREGIEMEEMLQPPLLGFNES